MKRLLLIVCCCALAVSSASAYTLTSWGINDANKPKGYTDHDWLYQLTLGSGEHSYGLRIWLHESLNNKAHMVSDIGTAAPTSSITWHNNNMKHGVPTPYIEFMPPVMGSWTNNTFYFYFSDNPNDNTVIGDVTTTRLGYLNSTIVESDSSIMPLTVIEFKDQHTAMYPEPGTFALMGFGVIGLIAWRRRRT